MHTPNWPEEMKGVMDVLSEAREKGIVKTHGVSIHSLEALQTPAKTPWCRVHLQGINFAGVRMDSTDPARYRGGAPPVESGRQRHYRHEGPG